MKKSSCEKSVQKKSKSAAALSLKLIRDKNHMNLHIEKMN